MRRTTAGWHERDLRYMEGAGARACYHRSIRVDTSVQAPESIAQASCAKCGGLMEVGALLGCYGALPW